MNSHLTDEQLNEWILGQAGSDVTRHLDQCPACRHEGEELKQALDGFRDSIHQAAGDYRMRWWAPAEREHPAWSRLMAQPWAYAATVALILVVSVVLLRFDRRRSPHPVAHTIGENEILMQIQADVSDDVPNALAPGELLLAAGEQPPPAPSAKPTRKAPRSARR